MELRRMYCFALVISSLAWLSVLCEVRVIRSLLVKLSLFWTPSGRWSSENTIGLGRRWKVSRPLFMALSVAPMEKMETMTPIMMAICCFQGVAPMRWPVLRSCEVSPALEAAMQTTPPIVMARAPKAGAVQPLTRKMAAVAMRVAMVMPETGEAELPTMPTIRAETVTKRKPKTTTRRAAAMLANALTCAPGMGLNWRKRNIRSTRRREPPKTTMGGRSCSMREGWADADLPAPVFLKP